MEIKKGEIYAMRLTNGQEIVAKINDISKTHYHMAAPLTIGQGQGGQMEFLPPLFCAAPAADAAILIEQVGIAMPAREDIIEVYEESIKPKSDVLMPTQKQIITG